MKMWEPLAPIKPNLHKNKISGFGRTDSYTETQKLMA